MTTRPFEKPPPDSGDRIAALEERVKELTGVIERLVEEREAYGDEYTDSSEWDSEYDSEPIPRPSMLEGARAAMRRALGGVKGESLESRVGGIWLGRIAAVLTMTAIALGAAVTVNDESVEAAYKLAIGYAIAIAALAYGLLSRRAQDLFAQTMLGCGLAVFYFVTYGAFFIDAMQMMPQWVPPLPVLAACLIGTGVVCLLKKSQTAAGISLFLLYYTIILSLNEGTAIRDVRYAFISIALISVMALVFHSTQRWMAFTWAALIGSHLTFLYFLWGKPAALDMPPAEYFWFSNGLLTLTYIVFALASIIDARKTGEYRRTTAPMTGFNSFIFLVVTWVSIHAQYPEWEWAFRFAITGLLVAFAVIARITGPPRNYLFQIYAAKAIVIFTLALQAYLSHEWFLIAMAVEGFGLALSYKRSGSAIFKAMALVLLGVTFVGCVWIVERTTPVVIHEFSIPANWFCSIGVAIIFGLTATLYEHFIQRPLPSQRSERAQWFLADTFVDVSSHTAALIHAAAAAVVLLVVTVIDMGTDPMLPFVLAGEALIFAVAGFALRTAPLEVACIVLLVASHATYHMLLYLDNDGFRTQRSFGVFTCLVAAFTFFGGYIWERYLNRIKGGSSWHHAVLASVPYLGAYLMLTAFLAREVEPIYVPLLENAVILGLLLSSAVAALQGLRLAGVLSLIASTANVLRGMFIGEDYSNHPDFIWVLITLVGTYFIAERLVVYWRNPERETWDPAYSVGAALVVAMAAVGVAGLWQWAPVEGLTYYLLAFAVITMVLGVGARSSGHRWAALAIYLIAIARAYVYDLTNLNQLYRFASFFALCVPLLIISWAYSQYRLRNLRNLDESPPREPVTPE